MMVLFFYQREGITHGSNKGSFSFMHSYDTPFYMETGGGNRAAVLLSRRRFPVYFYIYLFK